MKKIIPNICRVAIGILFISSGFAKGIDPMGSAYKFGEYFNAFGIGWMNPLTPYLAILLSAAEFLTGAALLFNARVTFFAQVALLFMAFFTPLTLALAFWNPVSDCGCFGDALVLTNWQTFGKNLILLLLAGIVFACRRKYASRLTPAAEVALPLLAGTGMILLSVHGLRHLPVLDFRPYATGETIAAGGDLPGEGANHRYEITLEYRDKRTGEIRSFSEEDYPATDTLNWEYVSAKERFAGSGKPARPRSLVLMNEAGEDITGEVLRDDGYTILVVTPDINAGDTEVQPALNRLAEFADERGYRVVGVTASAREEVQAFRERHAVPYDYCSSDEIELKTMIRANPGVIITRGGTILDKRAGRDVPRVEELDGKDPAAYCLAEQRKKQQNYFVCTLVLLSLATYLLLPRRRRRKHGF